MQIRNFYLLVSASVRTLPCVHSFISFFQNDFLCISVLYKMMYVLSVLCVSAYGNKSMCL